MERKLLVPGYLLCLSTGLGLFGEYASNKAAAHQADRADYCLEQQPGIKEINPKLRLCLANEALAGRPVTVTYADRSPIEEVITDRNIARSNAEHFDPTLLALTLGTTSVALMAIEARNRIKQQLTDTNKQQ